MLARTWILPELQLGVVRLTHSYILIPYLNLIQISHRKDYRVQIFRYVTSGF